MAIAQTKLKAPCGHVVRSAPLTEYATLIVTRTCSRHHRTWTVKIQPVIVEKAFTDDMVAVHEMTWRLETV